jgi:signal transduction histidine kinase
LGGVTTGYELCRLLKTDPITASIPILHTSATFTESSDRAYGLEGGADGYLIQPIDAHELTATVQALLRVRAAENAAKALASQWQTTFDSISDGLCLVDPTGKVVRFNKSFAGLFPVSGKPLIGTSLEAILGDLFMGRTALVSQSDVLIQSRWYRVSSNPIQNEDGSPVGIAWVFSDINSIREAESKLQDINAVLEQHVAERTASLQAALHQLEQFSYAVSHDLRAPLRAMQGYSNALLEDYAETMDTEGLAYLKRISDNATRLDKMIVDVLTFTKISRESPILKPLELAPLLRDIIEHYPGLKPPAAQVDLDLPHRVMANESGLVQGLSNLLGNAVKFVATGVVPKIKVWSELKAESMVRIWVEDNGIGIAPQYQNRLFGMFERVNPSNEFEGTGVGLAITRKVVERMGGTTGMESDGNSGCKFWIELKAVGKSDE